jgi:surfeit locus 1 family protein
MSRRSIIFCAFALLASVVFLRLGLWQLARLDEKVQRNALIASQRLGAPVQFALLPHDTAGAHYRAAIVAGRFDYDRELVLSFRTYQGSPGVELVTPMRVPGSDTAVLVDRGWVYSPDGATVDRRRWREGDSATVVGYVELFVPDAQTTTASSDPRIVRRMNRREVASRIPYPIAPYYVIAIGDSADGAHPARRGVPVLDEGPHRGYAMQWFLFALIALFGAGMVILQERRAR